MADIFDQIAAAKAKAAPTTTALPEVDGDGNFARGLRSGALGAGAQLNALAGTAAEALGQQEFADARYADMRGLSERAQAAAPRISSYKDVNSLRDAGDYVAGMVGQSAPSLAVGLGASLATGGALVPGLVAGALAQTPLEAGDVAMRQQMDPTQRALGAGERLVNAGVTGLGSAALQSVVPAVVGGKVLGKTAAAAGKMGAGKIIGRGVADIGMEGATEGAGEAVKQLGGMQMNPEQQLDTDAILENAVGGMAGGAPMAGLGTAGELVHAKGDQAKRLVGRAADAVQGAAKTAAEKTGGIVGRAKDTVQEFEGFDLGEKASSIVGRAKSTVQDAAEGFDLGSKAEEAKGKASDALGSAADYLGAAFAGMKDKSQAALDRVASGEDFFNPESFAGKAEGALRAAIDMDGKQRSEAIKGWANELAGKALSPENKAKLDAFMTNPGERMNEMAVAGMKKAQDATEATSAAVKRFADAAKPLAEKAKGKLKLSEDYTAADKLVREAVTPFMQEKGVELSSNDDINTMASSLRMMVSDMSSGRPPSWGTLVQLNHVVGAENARPLLERVRNSLVTNNKDNEAFYRSMNALSAVYDADASLTKLLSSKAPDTSPKVLRKVAEGLVQWASASGSQDGPASVQRRRYLDTQVKAQLTEQFGKDADAIMNAAQKFVKADQNRLQEYVASTDEEGNVLDDAEAEADLGGEREARDAPPLVKFHEKGRVYLNADDDPGKKGNLPAVTQALTRAQTKVGGAKFARFGDELSIKDHPNAQAKYDELTKLGLNAFDGDTDLAKRYADQEINKYGMIVSEQSSEQNELAATVDELESAKLDGKNFSRSSSRLDKTLTGLPYNLDAVKLTDMMAGRLKGEGQTRDIVGRRPKEAQHFMDALAMVYEATGKTFVVPDDTVISKSGMTYAQAKKLTADGKKVQGSGGKSAQIDDQIRRAKWSLHFATKDGDLGKAEKAKDKLRRLGATVEREMIADSQPEDLTGFGGETREGIPMERRTKSRDGTPGDTGRALLSRTTSRLNDISAELAALDMNVPADRVKSQALWREAEILRNLVDSPLGTGQQEFDPFGPTFQNGQDLDTIVGREGINPRRDEMQGAGQSKAKEPPAKSMATMAAEKAEAEAMARSLGAQRESLASALEYLTNPPENYSPERARTLVKWAESRRAKLSEELSNMDPDDERYDELSDMRLDAALIVRQGKQVLEGDAAVAKMEGRPDPKAVAAKKAALVEKARSGDQGLIEQLRTSNDAKGLQRAAELLAREGGADQTVAVINQRLGELVADPDVEYGMQLTKYTLAAPQPGAGPRVLQPTFDYLKKVLGNSVAVNPNAAIAHAGEFEAAWQGNGFKDTIRLSANLLNPLSTAFHESMHAFVSRMMAKGDGKVIDVLHQAASSPTVRMRLNELLKHSPEALRQLDDAEERIAYMYQFHAAGHDLGLGAPARGFFERVTAFLRSLLGVWSNDERALHIMDYFQSGEYIKTAETKGQAAVREALMAPGRNVVIERIKSATAPLTDLADQLAVAGHQRLRDTGIPALRELADLVKLQGTGTGRDPGYIPAARTERAKRMNRLAELLHGTSRDALDAAMESMQREDKSVIAGLANPEDRLAARLAVKSIQEALKDTRQYMLDAGVVVGDLGPDYFPRVWDVSFIAANKQDFLNMLQKYKQSGELQGDPQAILQKLMTSEGSEMMIETGRPGMQHIKTRELSFITAEDAAQFVNKNLYETLNSYITQATRRAEWARRFGEFDPDTKEPTKLSMLMDDARRQGATAEQIETANKYLMAVDGTLGDKIDPEFRRLQGNIMVYQNIRLLPLAIFSSISDPIGIAVRGGTMGDAFAAFKRGMLEIPKGFKKETTDDEATKLAQTLGVIESAALTRALGTSFSQGMVGDTGRKINDTFFRWNLMEQFNTSMRVSATQAAVAFIARHAGGQASPHSMRWMAELGLTPGQIKLDAAGKLLVTEADGLSATEAATMREAINRWVDGAVLRPDAADKPIWMNDPHFALVSHLKQFAFSFQETILKRLVHESRAGNNAAFMAAASYVPVMIAADILKGALVSGGGEPAWKKDWGFAEYVEHGIERAGLLGVAQFGVDAARDVGRGGMGVGALVGPTVEQMGDAVQVLGGRESMGRFTVDAMPAHSLMSGLKPERPNTEGERAE